MRRSGASGGLLIAVSCASAICVMSASLELALVALAFALLAGAALIETSQIAALQSLQYR